MSEPGSSQKAEPSTEGGGGQPPEGAASAGTVPLILDAAFLTNLMN